MRNTFMVVRLLWMAICIPMLLFTSCSYFQKKTDSDASEQYSEERRMMETEAQTRLLQARQQLETKQYDAAKATIKKMRKECYLALRAREEGILLMDSIELRLAQDNLVKVDSLLQKGDIQAKQQFQSACQKVQFFERKLTYDKKSIEQKQK